MKLSISTLVAILTSLASAAPTSAPHPAKLIPRQSLGSAIVINDCSLTTYLQVVSDTAGPVTTLSPGDSFSGTYQTSASGNGVSIKIGTSDPPSSPILQFEYVTEPSDGLVFYDLSFVNGNPFQNDGLELVPSDASCQTADCKPGDESCGNATPNGDNGTHACGESASLTLSLCHS